MLHIPAGHDTASAHPHATVAEARDCEAYHLDADAEARAEQLAESAWLRAAEYSPRIADEDARELAREAAYERLIYSD